jgi:hypothetical protein
MFLSVGFRKANLVQFEGAIRVLFSDGVDGHGCITWENIG